MRRVTGSRRCGNGRGSAAEKAAGKPFARDMEHERALRRQVSIALGIEQHQSVALAQHDDRIFLRAHLVVRIEVAQKEPSEAALEYSYHPPHAERIPQ